MQRKTTVQRRRERKRSRSDTTLQVFGVPSSPRLFANCWNASQLVSEYNSVNAVNLTFEEILLSEVTKTLENLVALDWRAQRFSQANVIATTEGARKSALLSVSLR